MSPPRLATYAIGIEAEGVGVLRNAVVDEA